MSTEKLDIKLLCMDVDGILTDGHIIVHKDGSESKKFHVHDGGWLRIWARQGLKTAVITGRQCPAVEHRLKTIEIDYIYQGAHDKIEVFNQLLKESQIPARQTAYIGDDVFDLPVINRVGHAATVPEGLPELKDNVDFITTRPGGFGCVGEYICHLLKKMDLFDTAMERYRR